MIAQVQHERISFPTLGVEEDVNMKSMLETGMMCNDI